MGGGEGAGHVLVGGVVVAEGGEQSGGPEEDVEVVLVEGGVVAEAVAEEL